MCFGNVKTIFGQMCFGNVKTIFGQVCFENVKTIFGQMFLGMSRPPLVEFVLKCQDNPWSNLFLGISGQSLVIHVLRTSRPSLFECVVRMSRQSLVQCVLQMWDNLWASVFGNNIGTTFSQMRLVDCWVNICVYFWESPVKCGLEMLNVFENDYSIGCAAAIWCLFWLVCYIASGCNGFCVI